jgi:hypothetical protein
MGRVSMLFASTGCSFTFGQGLYWDRILERYSKLRNWPYEWSKIRTMLTVEDLKYMKSFTYSYLLSKTLDCEYITNPGDGMWEYNLPPSNFESYKVIDVWIENQQKNIDVKLDFIILQLTAPERDKYSIEESAQRIIQLNTNCEKNDIKLFVWSWRRELADKLDTKDFWIKLLYNDREYNSLEDWQATFEPHTGEYPPLYIYDEKFNEFGIDDRHPTKFTNQVVHDSILKKIKDIGIV